MHEIIKKIPLNSPEDELNDRISHFALRLAFLIRPEEQNWFIRQEVTLLRYRLESLMKRGKLDTGKLLEGSGIEYPTMKESTFLKYRNQLENLLPSQILRDPNVMSTFSVNDYYIVPFERALDIVARRKCLLKDGNAFVYKSDILGIVLSHFQSQLENSLSMAQGSVNQNSQKSQIDEDDRIGVLLSQLTQRRLANAASLQDIKTWKSDHIDINNIDNLAKDHFPLCMQTLHIQLRKTHKLKHMGRMQYGLFLKGIGVSLEDALHFWKQEFTRVMTQKEFDQEHVYNIRHSFGQEGRRADYVPYGCAKIINMGSADQPPDQVHGCPFKNFSNAQLANQLQFIGASSAEQTEIFQHVEEKRYQVSKKKKPHI